MENDFLNYFIISVVQHSPMVLRLHKPKTDKKVQWREGTVDNEFMGKKSSKCMCRCTDVLVGWREREREWASELKRERKAWIVCCMQVWVSTKWYRYTCNPTPLLQVAVSTQNLTSLVSQTQRVTVMEMMIVATSTGWPGGECHTNTPTTSTKISQARNRDKIKDEKLSNLWNCVTSRSLIFISNFYTLAHLYPVYKTSLYLHLIPCITANFNPLMLC